VVVRSAGNQVEPGGQQGPGQGLGVGDHLDLIGLELGAQGLAEGHGLGGDDVHQRAALHAGEDLGVQLLAQVGVVGQDHAAARAAQGLVRGGGHDVGVAHGRGVHSGGDEPGDVGHVAHQRGAPLVGRWPEAARSR
jgi:hypothetical protein